MIRFAILCLPVVIGCGTSSPSANPLTEGGVADATCALAPSAKGLIRDLVQGFLSDTANIASHSTGSESAFAISMPGSEIGFRSFAFLLERCDQAKTFVGYCDSASNPDPPEGFFADHDLCSRLGCEAAGIYLFESWLTMKPKTFADPPHRFTYTTTRPAGTAVQEPNPHITWRADIRDEQRAVVSSTITASLTINPDGEPAIDASYTASLRGVRVPGTEHDDVSATVSLRLPAIAGAGEDAVTVSAAADRDAAATGEIRQGATVLGRIAGNAGTEAGISVSWQGSCAQ